ncbi:hypothetical protein Tco_0716010 [Tanacetum coccineum]
MKNLDDNFTFGDQFLNDKPMEDEPGKANVETKVESMVTVLIHQASSSVPPLSTPVIDLSPPKPVSPHIHDLYSKIDKQVNEVVKEAVNNALQDLLHHIQIIQLSTTLLSYLWIMKTGRSSMKQWPNLVRDVMMTKILLHLLQKTPTKSRRKGMIMMLRLQNNLQFRSPQPGRLLTREAPSISSKKKFASPSEQPVDDVLIPKDVHLSNSKDTGAAHLPKIKTRPYWLKPVPEEETPKTPQLDWVIPPYDLPKTIANFLYTRRMAVMETSRVQNVFPEGVNHRGDSAHLPKYPTPTQPSPIRPHSTHSLDWVIPPYDLPKTENNWPDAIAKTYKDPKENKLLRKTRDMGSFIKWYCKQIGKSKLVKADLEGPAYKLVKPFHKNSISLQFQMKECHLLLTDKIGLVNPKGDRVMPDVSKPLPLGGPPGQVTIQTQYFFNKDLEYLVLGDKERRNALSISKLKAAYYPDFGLEELAVRSHMRSLSVVSVKTFSRYGYTYLREIVSRRANYKEYKISKADFKNLHPNDFEDMYLLHLQGKLNHLSGADKVHLFTAVNLWIRNIVIRQRVEDLQLGIESYQTKLNLTQPGWDATDFLFKEDYTIVHKPRAVIYRDRNNQKMMQETEVHKFNDGTLTRILEKLDHMVKYYELFKFNPSMKHRIWSEDDKRRSQEFIKLIERRLKIRRIFRNLESFVSGLIKDIDYRLITITE